MRKAIRQFLTMGLLAASLGLPAGVYAQNNNDQQTAAPLTLSDAIKKGLDASKTLRLDKAKIDQAMAHYEETQNAKIPKLTGTLGYTYLGDIDSRYKEIAFPGFGKFQLYVNNNYLGHAAISEPIFAGGKMKYAEQSASYLLEASKLDADNDHDAVIMNIVNAYYNLYKLQASQKLIQDNIAQIEQHLKEVQGFLKQGTVTKNDVLQLQIQLSNRQMDLLSANNNIGITNYNFNVMLGQPVETPIVLDTISMFTGPKNLKPLEEYYKDGMSQRQDLKAADLRTKAADAGIKVAESNYYPTISVGMDGYYSRPNQRYFPVLDAFRPSWDAGVNLSWDITGLYTNKKVVAEANAIKLQSQVAHDIITDNISNEVNADYVQYTQSLQQIQLSEQTIDQAQENYRLMKARYDNHVALLSDLQQADVSLLQAKINLMLAKADAEVAYNKLLKATGSLK
jgi:outer membrane protein TolC